MAEEQRPEQKILRAFLNPKYPDHIRSVKGIAKETGLTVQEVQSTIEERFVGKILLATDNNGRYMLILPVIEFVINLGDSRPGEINPENN